MGFPWPLLVTKNCLLTAQNRGLYMRPTPKHRPYGARRKGMFLVMDVSCLVRTSERSGLNHEASCFGRNGRNGTTDRQGRRGERRFRRGAGSLDGTRRSAGSRSDRGRCSQRKQPRTRPGRLRGRRQRVGQRHRLPQGQPADRSDSRARSGDDAQQRAPPGLHLCSGSAATAAATAASCSTGSSSLCCSARRTRTRTVRKPRSAPVHSIGSSSGPPCHR